MSNYGSLKTLVALLSAAPSLAGVSVVYGEENIRAQQYPLPMVTIVPIGGNWIAPGYYKQSDPYLNNLWMTQENIELTLWSADIDSTGRVKDTATAIDHADAVENLRCLVLQAFQRQQAQYKADGTKQYGFLYRPVSGRWERQSDEANRYGRVYVLTVQVDLTVPDVLPDEAPVTGIEFNPINITG